MNNLNGVLPPDANGAVGPNHYVQWVNLSFAIWNESGTKLYRPTAGNALERVQRRVRDLQRRRPGPPRVA